MRHRFGLPLLAMLLSGCGADLDSPGEALRIFASTVDPAYLSEDYTFDFVVQGGLAPYGFEIREGRLPPGLTLENGTISGVPSQEGNFTFTLQVSDANLSQAIEEFTIDVTTAPPAELVLNVPPTTVREAVRIPISVEEARNLQALRTQITWDESLFTLVPDSVQASQSSVALLQEAREGQLNIDVVFLGPSLNGDSELLSFELEPTEPSLLTLSARTEYRSRDGEHGFSSTEDSAAAPEDDTNVTDGADATTDPNAQDTDGDGVPDVDDPEPDDPDIGAEDEASTFGDPDDPDDDGDGVLDIDDPAPFDPNITDEEDNAGGGL